MSGQGNAKEAEEGQDSWLVKAFESRLRASGATAIAEYSSGSVGIDTKKLPDVPVPKEPLKALGGHMSWWLQAYLSHLKSRFETKKAD